MSRLIFESVKILKENPNYVLQWGCVLFNGYKSGNLYRNHLRSVCNAIRSDQLNWVAVSQNSRYTNMIKSTNHSKFDTLRAFSSNVILYSTDEKESKYKFFDKILGNCEVQYRKTKDGEDYKIVVCKPIENNKKERHFREAIPPEPNIFKVLGAVALTLAGIILAAYSVVFFVSIAANIIVFIAVISFFIISYRVIKDFWLLRRYKRR